MCLILTLGMCELGTSFDYHALNNKKTTSVICIFVCFCQHESETCERNSCFPRFMTDAARREQETMKKKATPKLSLSITGGMSRNSTATPPRHTSGNLTPPVTPPITPSSSFRSSTPTGTTGVVVKRAFWGEERWMAHTCGVNWSVESDECEWILLVLRLAVTNTPSGACCFFSFFNIATHAVLRTKKNVWIKNGMQLIFVPIEWFWCSWKQWFVRSSPFNQYTKKKETRQFFLFNKN